MKKKILLVCLTFLVYNIYSHNTFFCIDGPLRIRSEPNLTSTQVGSLQLFDTADIIDKTPNKTTIDRLSDYWYKIKTADKEGYVFGGYGIELQERYIVKEIDDIIKAFPDKFIIENTGRHIFTANTQGNIPMVALDSYITLMGNSFSMRLYFRPSTQLDITLLAKDLNLTIGNYSNYFGRGDSYKILKDENGSDPFITNHGDKGRYFFSDWASDTTYDIANFLFETKFWVIFDGILVSSLNSWTNPRDRVNIPKISNEFIKEARTQRIKESIIFQILYEVMLRIDIE